MTAHILTPMRVLVACEFSGVVRNAFLARGHDAWSCDLLPSEDGSNRHIIGDARNILNDGWDLLMVAHPPCTRLCRSGHRWLFGPEETHPKKLPKGRTWESMLAEFETGIALFTDFWRAPIDRVAIENPVMHPPAQKRMPSDLPKPHIVQPWQHGDPAFKATGLYLRGLPPLQDSNRLAPPARGTDEHKRWSTVHRAPPGPDRWKIRSRTFPGIANAMADQWGSLGPVKKEGPHSAVAAE